MLLFPCRHVGASEHSAIILATQAKEELGTILRAALMSQHVKNECRERDHARRAGGLWRLRSRYSLDGLNRSPNGEAPRFQIDVSPTQPEQFTPAQTRPDRHGDRCLKIGFTSRLKKLSHPGRVEVTHLPATDARVS